MSERIHVAITSDANYLVHARVMLCSLFDNNKQHHFTVYLFTEINTHRELIKIKDLVNQYNNELHIHIIKGEMFEQFHVSGHVSTATYYRLLIPQLISHLDKVLYLDTDLIIKADIADLWKTPIANNCVAAVDEKNPDHVKRLDLPTGDAYFNAGVMLINIKSWNNLDITRRGLEIAATYKDKLVFFDQDALNMLLFDQWLSISPKWNQAEGGRLGYLFDQPTIIHFVGFKPWSIHCIHPFKKEYYRYYYKMEGFEKRIADKYQHYVQAFKRRLPFNLS